MSQSRPVTGQLGRDRDKLTVAPRDKLGKPEIRELAVARASDDRAANASHDRHAHPQRIQARCVSIVRKRVEADVDPVIKLQVLRSRSMLQEFDPRGFDGRKLR